MTYSTIKLAYDSRIATITFSRPEKRNALSVQMIEEILAALAEVESSDALVLIITGAGKAFCAGMDLEELKSLATKSPTESLADSERMARLFRSIFEFPKPTIAAVNGAAMAGGAGIATMCDFTIALAEATFGYTEVRIGFIPAIVSSVLVWQVGHKVGVTKKLLNSFLAKPLDQQIQNAVRDNAAIRQTADFQEGVASFLEKRKPIWSGK